MHPHTVAEQRSALSRYRTKPSIGQTDRAASCIGRQCITSSCILSYRPVACPSSGESSAILAYTPDRPALRSLLTFQKHKQTAIARTSGRHIHSLLGSKQQYRPSARGLFGALVIALHFVVKRGAEEPTAPGGRCSSQNLSYPSLTR